jgi:hypothetical protein
VVHIQVQHRTQQCQQQLTNMRLVLLSRTGTGLVGVSTKQQQKRLAH